MEKMIERLVAVGYTLDRAIKLYRLYEQRGNLDVLLKHVEQMEFVPDFS